MSGSPRRSWPGTQAARRRADAAASGRARGPSMEALGRGKEDASAKGRGCRARPAGGIAARSSWEPLRPERVCEVGYDHMQGTRFPMPRPPALATRQAPAGLPLRSAGSHARLRAGPRFRRARPPSQPCAARGPGIIVRFGRNSQRALALGNVAQIDPDASVQLVDRPRIELTRTSSTCSRAAASRYRTFQRSRPASASVLRAALATVMSGWVDSTVAAAFRVWTRGLPS